MATSKGLKPAYLINGEDELKRETVLKRLRQRVAKSGDIDFNSDLFSGATASGADIVAACNTIPFASDVRLVVVRNVDALKKADADALADYLASPNDTTVLAMESANLDKKKRLYKAVQGLGADCVIDCTPRKAYKLPEMVQGMAVTHGVTIDGNAARRLIELVGTNTVHLDSELNKIALAHTGAQAVGVSEVEALVTRTATAKPWDVTDAFAARDTAACIQAIRNVEGSTPISLLSRCVSEVRVLLTCHALAARGRSGVNDLASYLNMPAWKLKQVPGWARGWRTEELRHAFSTARDAERKMKNGYDADAVLTEWILHTLTPQGRA